MSVYENDVVLVPFGTRKLIGLVNKVSTNTEAPKNKLKRILVSFSDFHNSEPPISDNLKKFLLWQANYYAMSIGSTINLSLNTKEIFKEFKQKRRKSSETPLLETEKIILSDEQREACKNISKKLDGFSTTLLDGETGSGKTEVFFSSCKRDYRKKGISKPS